MTTLSKGQLIWNSLFDLANGSDCIPSRLFVISRGRVTIRVEADGLAWLKRQGRGYQTGINKLLREPVEGKRRRA